MVPYLTSSDNVDLLPLLPDFLTMTSKSLFHIKKLDEFRLLLETLKLFESSSRCSISCTDWRDR